MATDDFTATEYETLQSSRREVAGNREQATVRDVDVGETTVRLELGFDWTSDGQTVTFDLDSEREVLGLKALARSRGYDYDHLPYLEGEPVTVVYLDGEWQPAATLPDADANVLTDTATAADEPGPVTRAYEGLLGRAEELTSRDVIVAAVVIKKLLIATALVYLLLTV